MASSPSPVNEKVQAEASESGDAFLQFRRKVQQSELLSAATARLLESLSYTGRVTILLQNGKILKSGYEEGYFRRKDDLNF
jgi:hypothetical protein